MSLFQSAPRLPLSDPSLLEVAHIYVEAFNRTAGREVWSSERALAEIVALMEKGDLSTHRDSSGLLLGFAIDTELSCFEHWREYIKAGADFDSIFVAKLAVADQAKREGTGRKLLEDIINKADEQKAVSVTIRVREGNIPMNKLITRLGFRHLGPYIDIVPFEGEVQWNMFERKL